MFVKFVENMAVD